MNTATVNQTETVNRDFVKAVKMQTKVTKLANMKASYRFRLAAITAADNRPGKAWETVASPAEKAVRAHIENRRAIGAW